MENSSKPQQVSAVSGTSSAPRPLNQAFRPVNTQMTQEAADS